MTRNLYSTVIIFPRLNFGITLHSLYRKNVSAEAIWFYIILTATLKLRLCFVYTTFKIPEAN